MTSYRGRLVLERSAPSHLAAQFGMLVEADLGEASPDMAAERLPCAASASSSVAEVAHFLMQAPARIVVIRLTGT
jgi:hypothetical protein